MILGIRVQLQKQAGTVPVLVTKHDRYTHIHRHILSPIHMHTTHTLHTHMQNIMNTLKLTTVRISPGR